MMSAEDLRYSMRARALKKRRRLAHAGMGLVDNEPHKEQQAGEIGFKVLERDASGAVKIFAVTTPQGKELKFEVTARDAAGAISSFVVKA